MRAPYLSIVMVGSNASYGGDFLTRMQICLDNLFMLAHEHMLDADLTIVEWNPPANRAPIVDAINWSKRTLPVQIITVPHRVHARVPNPHNETFFEYWAKNVGIRRAPGDYILSTNPDNIYSPTLINYLAQKKLEPAGVYRVDRTDMQDGKVLRVNKATAGCPHFNASGDFLLMSSGAWWMIHGHPEVPYSLTVDGQTLHLALRSGLREVVLPDAMWHQEHFRTPKYCPTWDDHAPWGERNGLDWGFQGEHFDTRSF